MGLIKEISAVILTQDYCFTLKCEYMNAAKVTFLLCLGL